MTEGALVLEGGSLRGLFTAGVLDVLWNGEYSFPMSTAYRPGL